MRNYSTLLSPNVDNSKSTQGRLVSRRLVRTLLAFVLLSATLLGIAGTSPATAASFSHTGAAPATHMQLKNSSGKVVCHVYDTSAKANPEAENCPAGTWTEQLFDSNWKQIGKNKQVKVGAISKPSTPSGGTFSHTGSAAATHMQLKDSSGNIKCKVYNTSANSKPEAECPAGTWTEQLFDSNWKQIGKNKQVEVDGQDNLGTDNSAGTSTTRKTLDGARSKRYWNSRKMEAAKDVLSGKALSAQNRSAGQPPTSTNVPAAIRKRTGRLFFTIPGLGDSTCTASVLATAGQDAIWTAGHCLHLNGQWATNVIFVPGYDEGQEPFGRWSAKQLWSLYGWTKGGNNVNSCGVQFTGGDVRYDLGVAILNTNNGKHIREVVGGNGLRFRQSSASNVEVYAYDGTTGANNDGCDGSVATSDKLLTGCSSAVSNPGGRPGVFAVSCPDLGPGSSGGGIFQKSSRGYYLIGITSHSDSRYPGFNYSPRFEQGAINLHNATKNL